MYGKSNALICHTKNRVDMKLTNKNHEEKTLSYSCVFGMAVDCTVFTNEKKKVFSA